MRIANLFGRGPRTVFLVLCLLAVPFHITDFTIKFSQAFADGDDDDDDDDPTGGLGGLGAPAAPCAAPGLATTDVAKNATDSPPSLMGVSDAELGTISTQAQIAAQLAHQQDVSYNADHNPFGATPSAYFGNDLNSPTTPYGFDLNISRTPRNINAGSDTTAPAPFGERSQFGTTGGYEGTSPKNH